MPLEIWTVNAPHARSTVDTAMRAEADGWDGITFGDSQNRVADVYVEMALAGAATSRLRLATWVTNPFTRHASVTAGAAATLQIETGGRVEMAIGRGDSALAHLGLAPAPLDRLERYTDQVRRYVRGEPVEFTMPSEAGSGWRSVESLGLGGSPTTSQLNWLDDTVPPVPVYIGASGPKVIGIGARVADGVLVSVGATTERIGWAREVLTAEREQGPDPDRPVTFGVHFPVAVHDDRDAARQLVGSKVATHARFSVMHGRVEGPASSHQVETMQRIRAAYDMNRHAHHGTAQTAVLDDDIVDTFAVAGPPDYCIERIRELVELGVDKLLINTAFPGSDPADEARSRGRLVQEVLPALR